MFALIILMYSVYGDNISVTPNLTKKQCEGLKTEVIRLATEHRRTIMNPFKFDIGCVEMPSK